MKEIGGLAQNPTLIPDPKTWPDDEFKPMKIILQHCLPLIRFFNLSSREFSQKVRPYQKLLDQQLYEDLWNLMIIDSKIVDSNIISTVSKWVDKVAIIMSNYIYQEI
uniref:Uncharacterized protein n=1 Tax=Rhizophagus irregularis (strain DAOM 181602 / DAOM 197198 / MUCL 43194) TaxID=747089 RepID=U9TYV4_RHIID